MEEHIQTRVSPEQVWRIWERAHVMEEGKGKVRYKILNIKKGESFSILWKSLFVRLIFNHKVIPANKGSLISYDVQIKGPFAWPVRWLIGEKIRKNLQFVLKTIVKELEDKSVV